jgi:hypothetical protein
MGSRPNTGVKKKHALQLFKTDMCKFFLENRCENGNRCAYAHDPDEIRTKPDLTWTSMCRTLLETGSCLNRSCRFAHQESELRATHGFFKMKMCVFAQSGRCKHGSACRFAHSPDELRPAVPALTQSEDDTIANLRRNGDVSSKSGVDVQNFIFGLESEQDSASARQMRLHPSDIALNVTSVPPPEPNVDAQSALHLRRQHRPGAGVNSALSQPLQAMPLPYGSVSTADASPKEREGSGASTTAAAHTGSHSGSAGASVTASRRAGSSADNSSTEARRPGPVPGTAWNERNDRLTSNNRGEPRSGGSRNESDSGDGETSWTSGNSGNSSATAMPRSDHTGTGSPPATSDSSSGAARVNSGGGSGGAGGAGSGTINGHGTTSTRRPNSEKPRGHQITTLIISNVPTYLTQGALLSMFEDLTFQMRGCFDFFYCPWDEKMGYNLGYALINFPEPSHAAEFQQLWSNKELCRGGRGHKPLKVMKATLQGLEANVEYFGKAQLSGLCTDQRFRPLCRAHDGNLMPLPLSPSPEPAMSADASTPEEPEGQTQEQDTQQMFLQKAQIDIHNSRERGPTAPLSSAHLYADAGAVQEWLQEQQKEEPHDESNQRQRRRRQFPPPRPEQRPAARLQETESPTAMRQVEGAEGSNILAALGYSDIGRAFQDLRQQSLQQQQEQLLNLLNEKELGQQHRRCQQQRKQLDQAPVSQQAASRYQEPQGYVLPVQQRQISENRGVVKSHGSYHKQQLTQSCPKLPDHAMTQSEQTQPTLVQPEVFQQQISQLQQLPGLENPNLGDQVASTVQQLQRFQQLQQLQQLQQQLQQQHQLMQQQNLQTVQNNDFSQGRNGQTQFSGQQFTHYQPEMQELQLTSLQQQLQQLQEQQQRLQFNTQTAQLGEANSAGGLAPIQFMMTPVWQMQASSAGPPTPLDGCRQMAQDGLLLEGSEHLTGQMCNSMLGPQLSQQVAYSQMVPYMMMSVKAYNMMNQGQQLGGWGATEKDEVYTD